MAEQGDLTADDVARMFGVDVTAVYKWEREGMLPKRVGTGRHTKWRRSEIEALVKKNTKNRE